MRTYVNVMILFWTRSRRYSTDALCANAGLPAPPSPVPFVESECMLWTSHSRAVGVYAVGVCADTNESPVADDIEAGAPFGSCIFMFPFKFPFMVRPIASGGGGAGTGTGEDDLKEERRF